MINTSITTPASLDSLLNYQERQTNKNLTTWTYHKHTDDFGIQNKVILISSRHICLNGQLLQHCVNDFIKIGEKEGFKVEIAYKFYYIRDSRIRLPCGKIIRSIFLEEKIMETAKNRLCYRQEYLKNQSGSFATKHQAFYRVIQGFVNQEKIYQFASEGFSAKSRLEPCDIQANSKLLTTEIGAAFKSIRSYLEGGNVFVLTNTEGEIKILIGEDSLILTHMILRQKKYFHSPQLENLSHIKQEYLSFPTLKTKVDALYVTSQIPTLVKTLEKEWSEDELIQIAKEMNAMGLITKFSLDTKEKKDQSKEIAKKYLAQKEFITQVLWPAELEVQPENIILIPNLAYHLDLFIKPGPKGSVFLQDFELTLQTLNKIKTETDKWNLSAKDRLILENYIKDAKQLVQDLQPLSINIKKQCEQAKIFVIPIAGCFFGSDFKGNQKNINFLNALSGYSERNQRFYYIAAGASIGDQLGKVLMEEFYTTLKSLIHPIEIYFIGKNPNTNNYQEAMDMINNFQAGPHCMVFPLETEQTSY